MATQKFSSIAPVLNVNSRTMQPTIDLFVEKLGFEIDTVLGQKPAFAMLKHAEVVVMLRCRSAIPWPQKGWAAYIWVEDISALHADLVQREAPIKAGPHDRDYGVREIEVSMPDGRQVVFGQVLDN